MVEGALHLAIVRRRNQQGSAIFPPSLRTVGSSPLVVFEHRVMLEVGDVRTVLDTKAGGIQTWSHVVSGHRPHLCLEFTSPALIKVAKSFNTKANVNLSGHSLSYLIRSSSVGPHDDGDVRHLAAVR